MWQYRLAQLVVGSIMLIILRPGSARAHQALAQVGRQGGSLHVGALVRTGGTSWQPGGRGAHAPCEVGGGALVQPLDVLLYAQKGAVVAARFSELQARQQVLGAGEARPAACIAPHATGGAFLARTCASALISRHTWQALSVLLRYAKLSGLLGSLCDGISAYTVSSSVAMPLHEAPRRAGGARAGQALLSCC
jgi:hypothetical protein